MKAFRPNGLPTAIGSMPNTDPEESYTLLMKYCPDIPVWPQLPQRSFYENMYVQFSEGFPGIVIEDERIYVTRNGDADITLEKLYTAYLENDIDKYPLGEKYARGFQTFLRNGVQSPVAVKGQITGPVSWALTVTDRDHRSIIYDDVLADAAGKLIRLKAAWQERELRRLAPTSIIFIDEPYLASLGSAFVSVSNSKVVSLLEEVFGGLKGLKGIHCCGNTDWSTLLNTTVDIINFDAYNYADNFVLFADDIKKFLDRGGIIGWGIVPVVEEDRVKETADSLFDRLQESIGRLIEKGISLDLLMERCIITPSCGLATNSIEAATDVLMLTADISQRLRKRF